MACKCADMDWSEVDKTLEHHPNCTATGFAATSDVPLFATSSSLEAEPKDLTHASLEAAFEKIEGEIGSKSGNGVTAQAYRDDKTFTDALSRELEPGSELANAQPNVCEIFGASHLWIIVGRTFCEPDEKLAQELFRFAQYPIILCDFSKTPPENFQHLEPGQIIHSEDVDSVKVIWDGATRYERAKQGYTTVLFACECGGTRREELIGREPPVQASPDCSFGEAWEILVRAFEAERQPGGIRDAYISNIAMLCYEAAKSGMDFTSAKNCNVIADGILDRCFKKP